MTKLRTVFLSHNKNDKFDRIVDGIADIIIKKKIEIHKSPVCDAKSNNINQDANEKIDNSFLMINFITKNYVNSLQCRYEASYAKKVNKKRIFIVLENATVHENIEEFLNSDKDAMVVEAYKFRMDSINEFVKELFEILSPIIEKINQKNMKK